jgi:sirohydrochlorin ferrochelatase
MTRRRPLRGRTACLLIGHGSRVPGANRVLAEVARALGRRLRAFVVEACFLEAAAPDIQTGIDRCVRKRAGRILFVPYFLYLGGHVSRDLPDQIALARRRHPGLAITIAPHLGYDRRLVAIVADRVRHGIRVARWE